MTGMPRVPGDLTGKPRVPGEPNGVGRSLISRVVPELVRGVVPRRLAVLRQRRDEGQVSILIFGLLVIVLILVIGGIDVTAAQIARTRLLDASDSAALDAANALDSAAAYSGGIGSSIVVSNATVESAAAANLASRPRPGGISSWQTAAGTGTTDGHTAVVVVQGVADLPMTGGLLRALGSSVTITVESRARAPLQ
ncbi:pilus assembly protein TadG-related protein [Lapillicoccus sp.]|uniref:pilus assembly protein TadG-related protein n=1 Tax=Lapillicoccus sp. TaxID=1909287 RepID=UPI003267D6FA